MPAFEMTLNGCNITNKVVINCVDDNEVALLKFVTGIVNENLCLCVESTEPTIELTEIENDRSE